MMGTLDVCPKPVLVNHRVSSKQIGFNWQLNGKRRFWRRESTPFFCVHVVAVNPNAFPATATFEVRTKTLCF